MCKFAWTLAAVLAVAVGLLLYSFVWRGQVLPAGNDGRVAIALEAGERDLVLAEMRTFLHSVQLITDGVAREDMQQVTEAARRSGLAAQGSVPPGLMAKLPGAFKVQGMDTHSRFDAVALDAEQLGDPTHTLTQMGALMQNCVACHAAYRFETVQGKGSP